MADPGSWLGSTSIKRWELIALALMVICTVAIGLILVNQTYQRTQNVASEAQRTQVAIGIALGSEKVCSESNKGEACRALFNRLASSIDQNQRRILACRVADSLKRPDLAGNIDCSDLPDRISIP